MFKYGGGFGMGSDLVFVTGASGYVAGHCILRLLTDGYKVRGTLRSPTELSYHSA